jgi:phenylalanyl-tRNA synthetase beta subunit
VRRRLAEPEFLALVDTERLRIAERTLDNLMFGADRATRTLIEIAEGTVTVLDNAGQEHVENVPASVRVSAARALLGAAVSWRDQVELDQRLSALEAAINARNLRVIR